MDLLYNLDWGQRHYLVYIDAEFQTFRLPAGAGDGLAAAGYVNTPYSYGMKPSNIGQNNYHFLLNLGFIVFDGEGYHTYNFAPFRNNFEVESPLFNNCQMLEPGYSTCAPAVAAEIEELRASMSKGGEEVKFPFYNTLSVPDSAIFKKISDTYNSGISDEEQVASLLTLTHFLTNIVPYSLIVHKGRNDLLALRNSALLYGMDFSNMDNYMLVRDLDLINFKLPGLVNKQLSTIQAYLVDPPPKPNGSDGKAANKEPESGLYYRVVSRADALKHLRDTIMAEIADFFRKLWSIKEADVTAHNPLVDCAYAMVVDVGLSPS